MDKFVDLSKIPYNTSNFVMPDLGMCHIQIKPYEDEQNEPLAYIIKENGEEVCSIGILNPYISNDRLSVGDVNALIQFLNTDMGKYMFCGKKFTKFDAIWTQWIGKNVVDGPARSIPDSVPDYTNCFE